MTQTDIAYTAGIVDGEGCIGIYPRGDRRENMHRVTVKVVNTNEWLCQWLRSTYGGSLHHRCRYPEKNHKTCWAWTVSGKQALAFLRLIAPYLKIKTPQAELAITFLEARKGSGYVSTDEERALAEAQRILMGNMNRVGVHPKEIGAT